MAIRSKNLHWRHRPCGHEGDFDMMRAEVCPGCGEKILVRDLKNIRPDADETSTRSGRKN